MKLAMYAHGGSANHGCEAIIRSTIDLINPNEKPIVLSYHKDEDEEYGLNELVDIHQEILPVNRKSILFIKAYLQQKIKGNYHLMDALQHKQAIDTLPEIDSSLFVGGDNYCYSDVKNYIPVNHFMRKKTKHMILWGASVEPELLNDPEIRDDISHYDRIVARETISYSALKEANPNTYLLPDPAFFLKAKETVLPKGFVPGKMIGINISPLVIKKESKNGIVLTNYIELINYILQNTNYGVALIPHVVWESNDDRQPLAVLYQHYKDDDRVCLVGDHNCMEQKYIINKCHSFIGARTHSTIAAYSSAVPTLVVGYSVKAKGIARDLFGNEDNYVLPVQNIKYTNDLLKAFLYIEKYHQDIHQKLVSDMNSYMKLQDRYKQILEF